MKSAILNESIVEDAGLAWPEGLGYTVLHVPEIAVRETLLPKLISGELQVKDGKQIIAEGT